jgi:hypothetical protein
VPNGHGVLARAWTQQAAPRQVSTAVIGLDDTLERQWEAKTAASSISRNLVRSSQGHFIKPGGISKWGDRRTRTYLFEATIILQHRTPSFRKPGPAQAAPHRCRARR